MVDPDLVVIFAGVVLTTVGYQVSRAIRHRIEAGTLDRKGLAELKGELQQLQQSVDSIAVEVERISEAQRFTAKLLSERGTPGPDPALGRLPPN